MDPLALVEFYKFLKGIRDALPTEDFSNYGLTPEQEAALRSVNRKILRDFKIGIFIICVLVPIYVNLATLVSDPVEGGERLFRYALPWLMTPLNLIIGIGFGGGFGLLGLPGWYLRSPFGNQWKDFAGTCSEHGVKAISVILCVIGFAYGLLVVWLSDKTGGQ